MRGAVSTGRWLAGGLLLALGGVAGAQQFHTVQVPGAVDGSGTPLKIVQATQAGKPFTVAGPQGAVLGEQSGNFEAWVWPMKLLSHLRITAELKDYPVPIDVNEQAATIDVRPERTMIVYSHAAITVRQIMFAPRETADGTGVVVLFQVDAVRPGTLKFEFTPEVRRMWPAPNYGVPSAEWVARSANGGGFYVLHTDMPQIAAAVTIPGAEPGVLAPYQEKPKTFPLELRVAFDPARDRNVQFPLLMVAANGNVPIAVANEAATSARPGSDASNPVVEAHPLNGGTPATSAQLGAQLLQLNDAIPALYAGTAKFWSEFLGTHLSVATPDKKFDDAIQWAEVSIEQAQVRYKPAGATAETGLTAGFFSSGDSARPGFGWFFGRDTLWTMYAIDSFGDFDLARRAMDFVMARQRADGKVMHEYSQTADEVDWKAFPYEYAAADATPLLIMAMEDYVDASGDTAYLKQHWLQIQKAWEFETTHDADGDGIYDNAQGTGWVESWPQGMPKQEIYLAVLDEQASGAMGRLAALMGDASLSASAAARGTKIASTIEREYAPAAGGDMWAFSWDGRQDTTATIYPSVAWWDGHVQLPNSDGMFRRWASPEFSTDWGTRDVGDNEKVYDPISYHQGTVWPLFTGWAAMAEYRTGRPLAGYQHLMENVNLTYAQDLGAVTELLSGEFYAPLGRSSSHQTWSSAMVLTPAMRGLFGIRVDAEHKTVWVDPQLPAGWWKITVSHLILDKTLGNLIMSRDSSTEKVWLRDAPGWKLATTREGAKSEEDGAGLSWPEKAPRVSVVTPSAEPGNTTVGAKVLDERWDDHSVVLTLSGAPGSRCRVVLDVGVRPVHPDGAKLFDIPEGSFGQQFEVQFPAGEGYQTKVVKLNW